MMDFTGKNILITGAAGALGKYMSRIFAEGNGDLVLVDLPEKKDELEKIEEEIRNMGRRAYSYGMDLIASESYKGLNTFLDDHGLVIHVLISNAGYNYPISSRELKEEIWDKVVDINLKASFFIAQSIANHSLLKNCGSIVFISSQHSVVGSLERAHYCAGKTGLIGLTRALALEWAKYGVRVNAVSPTFVEHEKSTEVLHMPINQQRWLNHIPLGRYATAEDVSNAVLFIASDMAGVITGHNLVIDGGYTIQ